METYMDLISVDYSLQKKNTFIDHQNGSLNALQSVVKHILDQNRHQIKMEAKTLVAKHLAIE